MPVPIAVADAFEEAALLVAEGGKAVALDLFKQLVHAPLLGLAPPAEPWLAAAAILLLSVVNVVGVRPGTLTQNVFTLLKLAAIAAKSVVNDNLPFGGNGANVNFASAGSAFCTAPRIHFSISGFTSAAITSMPKCKARAAQPPPGQGRGLQVAGRKAERAAERLDRWQARNRTQLHAIEQRRDTHAGRARRGGHQQVDIEQRLTAQDRIIDSMS